MTAFNKDKHKKIFSVLPWEPMYDEEGNLLEGIRGKTGATEIGSDGEEIGVDLIEMQPGSSFPLHTHDGDHILYAISGVGSVTIDNEIVLFREGTSLYIEAKYPHNVGTFPDEAEPFVILAVGHPKKHVSALDRMHVVKDAD